MHSMVVATQKFTSKQSAGCCVGWSAVDLLVQMSSPVTILMDWSSPSGAWPDLRLTCTGGDRFVLTLGERQHLIDSGHTLRCLYEETGWGPVIESVVSILITAPTGTVISLYRWEYPDVLTGEFDVVETVLRQVPHHVGCRFQVERTTEGNVSEDPG